MPDIEQIRKLLTQLTNKQRGIAEYILANPVEVTACPLRELARRTGASEVSVLRTCAALGFDGYAQLRRELTQYTQSAFTASQSAVAQGAAVSSRLNDVCAADMGNLTRMMDALDEKQLFESAGKLLAADEIFIFAHDATVLIAQYFARRLDFMRAKSTIVPVGDGDTMHSILARLSPKDCAVIFSFPPYHAPIRNVANYCRHKSVPIIAVTDSMDSPAAAEGSSVFICDTSARYFYNSQTATVSFINILSACMAMAMGRRFDDILAQEQDVNDFLRGGYSAGKEV